MPYDYIRKNGTRVVVHRLGERGVDLKIHGGRIQDFDQLRYECLARKELFKDPDFPCNDSSVWGTKKPKFPVVWRRPPEICKNPSLFVQGVSRFDVVQGKIGNCWMVAATANLTLNDELFARVVPTDQSFHSDYAGIFHFRIWKANRWIDVVVDDRLPTSDDKLIYMKSRSGNEFWSALLEKAYAKIHGSYEALSGGSASEAMEDFTGGLSEDIDLKKPPKQLFRLMLKAYERSSLMCCSLSAGAIPEEKKQSGLVAGHAYSITAVRLLTIKGDRVPLIRLRNPWGDDTEWRGAWSDKSREWNNVSAQQRVAIGLTFDSDGEFWMSESDFIREFDRLEICNLSPDSLDEDMLSRSSKKKWEVATYEGSWVRGVSAGGCRNHLDTFWMNPQYFITLEDPDDDDDDRNCTLIVALMQKNRRAARTLGAGLFFTIGFVIYKVKDPKNCPKPLDFNFFKFTSSAGRSHKYVNTREVTTRFNLPPGTYCIVPSTFEPNQTAQFLLRIFSEKKNVSQEHDLTPAIIPPPDHLRFYPRQPSREVNADGAAWNYGRAQQMQALFAKIAGSDMEVTSQLLQRILSLVFREELKFEKFSLEACRSMIALMDEDHTGKLGLEEFRNLWFIVKTWKNVFAEFDKHNSGHLKEFELRAALTSAGFQVNQHILRPLVLRYGNDDGNIGFDDFIGCAVKLKQMMEVFIENKDPSNVECAVFTLSEWLMNTMYS
ncbi:hypothetical protein HPB48_014726 [Haemaphysalis longicornis]|uniref:Uncharacterized protein n=1 Tax=Haemaphysalis longicornis TaxID=44386 RepID=A0A9J6G5J5_HAELO|nr:hypothetical protein HPB48_014726 [Haemaphysalis longicornis]